MLKLYGVSNSGHGAYELLSLLQTVTHVAGWTQRPMGVLVA